MMRRSDGYRGPARGLAVAAMLGAALAAVTSCSAGQPAALPKASCGQASTHNLSPLTQVFHAGTGALPCFATAARQCKRASIAITEMGVDTGTDYVFAIVPGTASHCQATEWSRYYSANGGGSQGQVVVTGCSATARADGVTLGCAGQDFLIPVTVTNSPG